MPDWGDFLAIFFYNKMLEDNAQRRRQRQPTNVEKLPVIVLFTDDRWQWSALLPTMPAFSTPGCEPLCVMANWFSTSPDIVNFQEYDLEKRPSPQLKHVYNSPEPPQIVKVLWKELDGYYLLETYARVMEWMHYERLSRYHKGESFLKYE